MNLKQDKNKKEGKEICRLTYIDICSGVTPEQIQPRFFLGIKIKHWWHRLLGHMIIKEKRLKYFKQVFFSFYTFYSENFHMIVVSTCIPFVISAIDNLFIIFWGFGVISSIKMYLLPMFP